MSRLTAAARRRMPATSFAGPGKSFPDNDRTHARMALSGASHSEHAGNISPEEEERIKRRVHRDWPSISQRLQKGKSK